MYQKHFARIDLNLFVVFDVIYREGSLTRAAEQLNLSQPAVSHALSRLRECFNDPLFERSGRGVAPTPLAKAIIGRVRTALQGLETTLTDGLAFDPASASRVFTLAARDVMEATALPVLMQTLQQQAPAVQLRSIRVPRRDIAAALTSGQLDFAVDVLLPVSEDIEHQLIGEQRLVVMLRAQHPLATQNWNLEAYLSARHVQVSSRPEGPGVEDFALTRQGKARRIALRCQNYHAAVQVVQHTDLLLTMPQEFAARLVQQTPDLLVRELPMPLPALELHLYWHRKANGDPAVMWLKEQLLNLF